MVTFRQAVSRSSAALVDLDVPMRSEKMRADDAELVDNLRRHVDILAGLIGPRTLHRRDSFDAAAKFVEHELHKSGYAVRRETYCARGAEVSNITAEHAGSSLSNEIVILGAHYDTYETTPGADDNASAVAVMLEVARLLSARPTRRTVRFVGFACEEPPHFYTDEMGSQIHARGCRARNEHIQGMICLEMVGYFSNEPGSQRIPPALPTLLRRALPNRGDFLAAVGNLASWRLVWQFRRGFKRATRLPLISLALPERISEIRLSDNSSFWDQHYPALMLTDTSFLRNPHYHLPTDTPDTLNYEKMADAVKGVLGGLLAVAGI